MMKPLIFAAVAMACAGTALAQAPRQSPLEMLARADTNGDGRITTAEVDVMRGEMFTTMDRNGDGFLSAEDRAERSPPPGAERRGGRGQNHMRADTNGDGKVSRAEFMAQPRRGFDMGDTNADGVLDQAELTALRARVAQRRNPG